MLRERFPLIIAIILKTPELKIDKIKQFKWQ